MRKDGMRLSSFETSGRVHALPVGIDGRNAARHEFRPVSHDFPFANPTFLAFRRDFSNRQSDYPSLGGEMNSFTPWIHELCDELLSEIHD
jgi:hypothetical protein